MNKRDNRKLVTARKRLKQIEELVQPYAEDVTSRPAPSRGNWFPTDHLESIDPRRDRKVAFRRV